MTVSVNITCQQVVFSSIITEPGNKIGIIHNSAEHNWTSIRLSYVAISKIIY